MFVLAKREAANKILDRVKKGEDFDKLATELSEDPSAKENHGDLNFFRKEQMVPEFSNAAFAMKKGDVSGTQNAVVDLDIIHQALVTIVAGVLRA